MTGKKKNTEKLAFESLGANNSELFLQHYGTLNGAVITGNPTLTPETNQNKITPLVVIHSFIHLFNKYVFHVHLCQALW